MEVSFVCWPVVFPFPFFLLTVIVDPAAASYHTSNHFIKSRDVWLPSSFVRTVAALAVHVLACKLIFITYCYSFSSAVVPYTHSDYEYCTLTSHKPTSVTNKPGYLIKNSCKITRLTLALDGTQKTVQNDWSKSWQCDGVRPMHFVKWVLALTKYQKPW